MNESQKLIRTASALMLGYGVPFLVFNFVNFMRPDLIQPMLDHLFGYALIGALVALASFTTSLYGFAMTVPFTRDWPRVLLIFCGIVFGTIPSIFGIFFGPIIYAFMFGNLE